VVGTVWEGKPVINEAIFGEIERWRRGRKKEVGYNWKISMFIGLMANNDD
jgi:hypothetical protein